ncbi:MAG: hypothetical protein J6S85_01590 [Methanobrevibacter sp.]|nr:hypothetical protein [Methanobrevibacter sp.]
MTEEKIEELIKTFPKNTVFFYKRDGIISRANTSDYYAKLGKCYDDCKKALEKTTNYNEVQDENLYQVTSLLEKLQENTKNINKSDIADKLREIVWDIKNIIDEVEE